MSTKFKHSLLLVDDEKAIVNTLKRLFRKQNYHIMTAHSGPEGLKVLKDSKVPVSLIISDQRMPEMGGAEFLEKAKTIYPDAVRVLLTGYADMNAIVDAVNRGEIHRYLTKPWKDEELLLQVHQGLEQYEMVMENRRLMAMTRRQNKELNELNRNLEKKVEARTEKIRQKNTELAAVNRQLENSFYETIRLLSSMICTLKPVLGGYLAHVTRLAKMVSETYSFSKEHIEQIEMAAMIHDIGLLGLAESAWTKDVEEMKDEEFKMFSLHPVIAATSLESVNKLAEVGEIILYHHENMDGTGFPNALKGAEIPLGSRIIAAVSDYCRIIHAWPKEPKAIVNKSRKYFARSSNIVSPDDPDQMLEQIAQKMILLGAGQKYDMDVVSRLINLVEKRKSDHGVKPPAPNQPFMADVEKIQEGMVLMKDLRLKDNRLLLVKGSRLKQRSIQTILKLKVNQLIDDRVFVSINKEIEGVNT